MKFPIPIVEIYIAYRRFVLKGSKSIFIDFVLTRKAVPRHRDYNCGGEGFVEVLQN